MSNDKDWKRTKSERNQKDASSFFGPSQSDSSSKKNADVPREWSEGWKTVRSEWVWSTEAKQGWQRRKQKKRADRSLIWFGGMGIAIFVVSIIGFGIFNASSGSTMVTGDAAIKALANRVSTSLPLGAVLLTNDEYFEPQNYTLEIQQEGGETAIWVWDYAAEDGDYVQILHNGTPLTDAFMIKHDPQRFTTPAEGLIQIRGVRDGGGGITYAIHFEFNGTTYFNAVAEGEENTYTLVKK